MDGCLSRQLAYSSHQLLDHGRYVSVAFNRNVVLFHGGCDLELVTSEPLSLRVSSVNGSGM